jgi:hypothetical protein
MKTTTLSGSYKAPQPRFEKRLLKLLKFGGHLLQSILSLQITPIQEGIVISLERINHPS